MNPELPIQKNLYTRVFLVVLSTIAKCSKQPKYPSVNEWFKKLQYIYKIEYYMAERKKELLPFAKWNKPVSEKQIPYDLTYKRNLMSKIKL